MPRGGMVLKNVVRETDEVGKGQIRMRTVFEQAIDQRSSTGAPAKRAGHLGACLQ